MSTKKQRTPRPKTSPTPQEQPAPPRLDAEGLPIPRLVLESKKPHTTCWLTAYYPTGEEATLVPALDAQMRGQSWVLSPYLPAPPLGGVSERVYESAGSAVFGGWTGDEARVKLAGVKVVADILGLPLYRKRLTLEDML